jgi:hypothetical protein
MKEGILRRVGRFLAPPVFDGNEDKTRTARLLHTIVLGLLLTAVPYTLSTAFAQPDPGSALFIVAAVVGFEVAIFTLLRFGWVRQPIWLLRRPRF